MRTHYGFDNLPAIARPVVTIGSFDGVHRGHRALLDRVIAEARRIGGRSVVVTFSPHPREVLPRGGADFCLLTRHDHLTNDIASRDSIMIFLCDLSNH